MPRCSGTAGWPPPRSGPGPPSSRSPTRPSSTTLMRAFWVAGVAVLTSSKNTNDVPSYSAVRRAHAGGSNTTPASVRTGSPAKSVGSWIDAITDTVFHPAWRAKASMVWVLPVPGSPHNSTGTPPTNRICIAARVSAWVAPAAGRLLACLVVAIVGCLLHSSTGPDGCWVGSVLCAPSLARDCGRGAHPVVGVGSQRVHQTLRRLVVSAQTAPDPTNAVP